MTPDQRELISMLFLLVSFCVVTAAAYLSYRIDVRIVAKREREWAETMARWTEENRVKREQRLKEEAAERLRMAQEARELSERNRVALQHMIPKAEVAK